MSRFNHKTLLIGWDGADWEIVIPLIDKGKLPNLERLITNGVSGKLLTIQPAISPLLWTTIATGKLPHKHGVLGFVEPNENGTDIRPITSLSRKCKAIWNILNESGRRSAVLGWWPSHPVEPINGVMVSNRYQLASGDSREDWPLPADCVHPDRLRSPLQEIRVHPSDIVAADILSFVPNAADIGNPSRDPRIFGLARILAETASVQSAATAVLQLEEWDFCAVYFDAIDHISHGFMQYHPPRVPQVREADFALFKGVVEGAYIFQDMMLGTLLDIVGDSTTVVLVSDHGFRTGDGRKTAPNTHGGPVVQHADYGILVIKGEGFRKDSLIFGSSIADITPTILHHLGLPIGRDMDGRVLTQSFEAGEEIRFIDSWETTLGDAGTHPEHKMLSNTTDDYEAIAQLTALGYIDPPAADQAKDAQNASRELQFNLATAYMAAGLHADAIPILEMLWDASPMESRFGNKLMHCHIALKQPDKTRLAFEKMLSNKKEMAANATASLRLLKEQYRDAPIEEWSKRDRITYQKLWKASRTNLSAMAFLRGWVLWAEGRHQEAIQVLRQVDVSKIFDPESFFRLMGECHLELNELSEARDCFQRVLELNQDSADAYLGLARCSFGQREYRDAGTFSLESISLRYFNPRAHFLYGACLYRCNRPKEAVEALAVAVQQHPKMLAALERLALIHGRIFGDKEKEKYYWEQAEIVKLEATQAAGLGSSLSASADCQFGTESVLESKLEVEMQLHRNAVRRIQEPFENVLVVVSGLPRSGTSMMMQLLAKGGVPVLRDEHRAPDASNPKGYYELERIKSLREDATWLCQHTGSAVKIVVPHLQHIPHGIWCRVIFMNRKTERIVESQDRMLRNGNKPNGVRSKERIAAGYKRAIIRDLSILRGRDNVEVYIANYDEFIDQPAASVDRLVRFLNIPNLNRESMIGAIDSELRHRDLTN